MGTNYYAIFDECPDCHRYDELHIGKCSAGWAFMFEGHRGKNIQSFQDWLTFLSKDGVRIRDEYDRPATLEQFKEMVKQKTDGRKVESSGGRECWLDNDGHSFSGYDFS